MPGTVEVKLKFVDRRHGWTERHWKTGVADLVAFRPEAVALAQARADLLGAGPVLTAVTVSDVDVIGDSVEFPMHYVGSKLFKTGDSDLPWTTLKIRSDGGENGQAKRTSYMSGIPDSQTFITKGFKAEAAWLLFWSHWLDQLLGFVGKTGVRPNNTGWGFPGKVKDPAVAPKYKVSVIKPGTPFVNVTAYGLRVVPGDKVRIGRVLEKGRHYLDGIFTVVRPIVPSVSFTIAVNRQIGILGSEKTYAQKHTVVFQNYTGIERMGLTRHKRGPGPDHPVGRRKKRK